MSLTSYLAPEGFEKDLLEEIRQHQDLSLKKTLGRLLIVEGPQKSLAFAQDTWLDVQVQNFESIKQAAKILKENGKWWTPYSFQFHRRASLIQENLAKVKNPNFKYGDNAPERTLSAWTLETENTIVFSPKTTSQFPLGEVTFEEDKSAPSRAYLKLWEYFTVTNQKPKANELCVDLGSSPGGWTWVLNNLGAQVISVDKAPLAAELQDQPNIQMLKKDAFTLKPQEVGPVDWLFSDIICYPQKLFELVQEWRASNMAKNYVCTIKFQGETDFKALQAFQSIPGSEIRHLSANKHEVTWSWHQPQLDNSRQV
ncbi:MAG: SAM-dependent methyltransferase [Pseudobdellovibrionaceae bacterium]